MPYTLRPTTCAKSDESKASLDHVYKWKEMALKGDADAQYYLAIAYMAQGNGFPKSKNKAFFWFRRSAANGNREALCELADCYMNGIGTPIDIAEGTRLKSLFDIRSRLFNIMKMVPGTSYDTTESVKAMMDTIYQFTGYVK